MSIKRQLQLAVIISSGLAAILGWTLFSTLHQVSVATQRSRVANEIVRGVFEQNLVASGYLLNRAEHSQAKWNAEQGRMTLLLNQAEGEFKNSNARTLLDKIREGHQSSQIVFSKLPSSPETSTPDTTADTQESEERSIPQQLLRSQGMVSAAAQLAEMSLRDIEAAQNHAGFLVVLFFVILAEAILGILFLISRKVLRPIVHLQNGARIIGEGNLDHRTKIGSGDEIGALSQAFDVMAGKLSESYTSLEEQAARLEAANQELEAFAYSVAHDLRAPLRAMDGFTGILMREHGPHLASDAQRYLRLVRDNTQQMGNLIDDLLTFSRLSRQALNRLPVKTSEIVSQALNDLSSEQEGRRVDICVGDLPDCHADLALLKQVFANLLGNALKYTRCRNAAEIEIGFRGGDGPDEHVYFVRDNGVGFDMRYSDKLFGVFQRLHRAEDYEGTGVGLAIVQRIIHRHGGRVWAEAEVNKGATFYFTLQGGIPNDTDGE